MLKMCALALLLTGCSLRWKTTKIEVNTNVYKAALDCDRLDAKQLGANASSVALGALGGVTGVVTVAAPDNKAVEYSMASLAILFSAAAGIASLFASHYTQQFCRQCANIVPPTGAIP